MSFIKRIQSEKPLIIDGGMGTILFQKAPDFRGPFEMLNIERPEIIQEIHTMYYEAGSELVETNSFGGSRIKLEEYGLAGRCLEINERAAANARIAAAKFGSKYVGGSMGPTGLLIEPMGETPAEVIYESFAAQAKGLENGGADAIIIETMTDIQEARLALLAVKENTKLPVICSMTFEENGKTVTGTDMLTGLSTLAQMGADAVGANCSMGPEGLLKIYSESIEKLKKIGVPLSVWSNAGFPEIKDGRTVYTLTPESFAETSIGFANIGVKIIGGCCGTTPAHIRALSQKISDYKFEANNYKKNYSFITSRSSTLDIKNQSGLIIVGERLNPSARKKFAEELKENKQTFLRDESRLQEKEGAHVLDINVGQPGIDEKAAVRKAVSVLTGIVSLPLMIDSDNPSVLEKALMVYPGVPIINSINGKEKSLKTVLPIIKRFGCFSVALCLDESGVHIESDKRISAGENLLEKISAAGISLDRIFVDPLILAESAEPGSAPETLKVIKHFAKKGIKTSIGLSNISFGLPQRKHVNSVFLKMAVEAGLTAAIINPAAYYIPENLSEEEKLASNFITGRDPGASAYIAHFKKIDPSKSEQKTDEKKQGTDPVSNVYDSVVEGDNDDIESAVHKALESYQPEEIMNKGLLAALEKVGELYSTGEYFLPQMISSANAMKKGFQVLKPLLAKKASDSLGKIIICTVRGDVHDIGKNIVAMMLENHGFEVFDLGKDVPSEEIIAKARELKPDIVCLSSLLTTTMGEMKVISDEFKAQGIPSRIMIGGAVVNDDYANSIGAYYGSDAVNAVAKAREIVGR